MAGRLERPRIFVALPEARVVLCVTPKAASTSIIGALLSHYGANAAKRYHLNPALPFLSRAEVIRYVPSYARAMFVRNPFDRTVANWLYHIKTTRLATAANMRRRGFTPDMTFQRFLAAVTRNTEADAHLALQCRQIRHVAFVGKVESIAEDWPRFRAFTGLDLPDLDVLNATPRPKASYRDFYSPSWRDRVARAYAADLEAFGYAF